MIDAYAATTADVAALAPVWWALEADERGTFVAGRQRALDAARREGLWPLAFGPCPGGSVLVTDRADLAHVVADRLAILEGSFCPTYAADPTLDPNHLVLSAGPLRSETVGVGIPRLDWWHRRGIRTAERGAPTVGVALGAADRRDDLAWQATAGYAAALGALVAASRRRGWRVVVHVHEDVVEHVSAALADVVLATTFDAVLGAADVLASDDRDRLIEFGRLAGPVAALTAPRLARAPLGFGEVAEHPGRLVPAITAALAETRSASVMRRQETFRAYPLADGRAAERAADALRRYLL